MKSCNRPIETLTIGFIDEASKLTQNSIIKERIAFALIKKGWSCLEIPNYSKALKHFNKALNIFLKKGNRNGYLLSSHGIASIYKTCKEYGKALEIYFSILNTLNNEDKELNFIILKDIAKTYYLWEVYDQSVKYLKLALKMIKKENSLYYKIYIHINLGKSYLKLTQTIEAQESLFMALTMCDSNNINYKISEALTLLGNIFRKKQNFNRAESFHIRALQYAKSNRNYKIHVEIMLNLGSLYFYSRDFQKGIDYIYTALDEIEHVLEPVKIYLKAYHYLFLCYKELGDIENSLKYLQKFVILKEEEKKDTSHIQHELLKIQLLFQNNPKLLLVKNNNYKEIYGIDHDKNRENMSELALAIFNGVKNILSFKNLSIYSLNTSSNTLIQTVLNENGTTKTSEIDGTNTPALYSIQNKKEIIFYDRETYNIDRLFNLTNLTEDMNSFIILPINKGNTVIGAVSIEDNKKNSYTNFDCNTLKTISAYISLSIENMRISSKSGLELLPQNKDIYSGLPLKPLFIDLLNQGIKGTKRDNGKIAICTIMIDLDFEKHSLFLSEDLTISEHTIAKRLIESLRSEDILGKENNGRFLLAFKMENINGCKTVAKKLVALVKEPIFTENQKIEPQVRIGLAIYPDNSLTPEDLLEKSLKSTTKITKENKNGYEFYESIHNIVSID